jgi:hypothetical protein
MDNKATDWSLADLIDDPLIGLIMRSDGVDRQSIEFLFQRVACSTRCREAERPRIADPSAGIASARRSEGASS